MIRIYKAEKMKRIGISEKVRQRGITLIALVVTLIILLILAGTSIAMLTGDNGIISQAQNAKNNSAKAEFEEKVKLAVTASRINEDRTRIDLGKLDSELKINAKIPAENIDKSGDNEGLPWIVTEKDYMYLITEDGRVVEINGIALDKSQLKLLKNESKTLKVIKSKDVNGDVTWSTENAAVATVDQNGSVTAVGNIGDTTQIVARVGTEYSATCNVTIVNNIVEVTPEEIAENPDKYYGQVVKNYTAGGATYRIFYVDTENKYGDGKNTVYLKADWKANDVNLRDVYTNYNKTTTKIKEMNPEWAKTENRGNIADTSWNLNEKSAAYLCTPATVGNESNLLWAENLDKTKANYVIGSPSVEMYCDSYNSVQHPGVTNYRLEAKYRLTSVPGYVYTVNGGSEKEDTGPDTVDYKNYGSMYCGKDGVKGGYYWWLASPLSHFNYEMCAVYGNSADLASSSYSNTIGVLPLVSLRSDFTIQIEK
ncbi:MAG: hypothetical protein HFJ55_07460 [Clostridia bacterium]|nr:hypothetical protein [Clostridia bacterium]